MHFCTRVVTCCLQVSAAHSSQHTAINAREWRQTQMFEFDLYFCQNYNYSILVIRSSFSRPLTPKTPDLYSPQAEAEILLWPGAVNYTVLKTIANKHKSNTFISTQIIGKSSIKWPKNDRNRMRTGAGKRPLGC